MYVDVFMYIYGIIYTFIYLYITNLRNINRLSVSYFGDLQVWIGFNLKKNVQNVRVTLNSPKTMHAIKITPCWHSIKVFFVNSLLGYLDIHTNLHHTYFLLRSICSIGFIMQNFSIKHSIGRYFFSIYQCVWSSIEILFKLILYNFVRKKPFPF